MPDFDKFKEALNSNAKSKENALDENGQLKERHNINGVPNVVSKTFEQSYTTSPETLSSLLDKGINVTINRTNIDNEEEQENIRKAVQQSTLAKIGNSLEQLVVDEVLLGTLKGFTDIYDAFVGHFADKSKNDYTSAASTFLEELQEKNREAFKIYRENPYKSFDFGDVGWWADNFVSVGSTLSLLIPSKGITAGIGKLGKLAKVDKAVSKGLSKLAKTAKGESIIAKGGTGSKILTHSNYYGRKVNEFADLAGTALMSRVAENYQEARGIYKDSYDKIFNNLNAMSDEDKQKFLQRNPKFDPNTSNEDIANTLASSVASNTFWADMPLILMDFIQYKGVESALKGGAKQVTTTAFERAQRKALQRLNLGKAAETAIDTETKGLFKKAGNFLLDTGRDIIKHPGRALSALELSEGFEEGWQGIAQAYNQDLVDSYLDGHHTKRTWDSYLTDGEVWEQAFWGALGGLVFQGAAKGLGKLKRKYDAKQALNKGEITQQQYQNFVRSQDEARKAEIEGRQEAMDRLVDDLTLIEAGKDPRPQKDGTYRNFIDSNDKARVQNEIIDAWIQDFTLRAVDNGNFDLLAEFIKSPEFNKYLQDNNLDKGILNSKSLASRVEDVYDLYIKNTEALLDNVSGDDYDSIRLAARWLTRNDLTIASEYDNIDKMKAALYQLNGYHPDASYEQLRKFDVLFNEYKKQLEIGKELEVAYKNHKISKSGYEAEKKFNDEYVQSLKELMTSATNFQELSDIATSGDVNAINGTLENLKKDNNFAKEWAQTPDQIKSAIDEIIKSEIILSDRVAKSPNTQEEFEDLYNSMNIAAANNFNTRVNKAVDRIRKYLVNADNIDAAVNSAMSEEFADISNPIERKRLQEAMSVLKVGSHSRPELTFMFQQEVAKIKADREEKIKRQNTAIINGKEVVNPNPETNPNPNGNVSSTGDIQQQKETATTETKDDSKPPVKEGDDTPIVNVGPEIEEVDTATPEDKEILKQQADAAKAQIEKEEKGDETGVKEIGQQFANDLSFKSEEDIKREIRSAFINIAERRPQLLADMVKNGIGSPAYNQFMNLSLIIITSSGLYLNSEIAPIMDYQLKIYLFNLIERKNIPAEQRKGIFNLIDQIDKILTKESADEKFSKISNISDEQFQKNMEEFFDKYFGLGGKVNYVTKNGVKIINLDGLFAQLVELSKAGVYNFEELAEIVNNIYNFATNYKGKQYSFVSDGIFDEINKYGDVIKQGYFNKNNTIAAKTSNLSTFINKLYLQQTNEKVVVDDNMHFNISSTIRPTDLQKAKGKKLKIKYENIGGVKTISLYYTNKDGKDIELGYLGTVEQGTKDNKTLKLVNETGIITSVTKDNGEIHITNDRIEEILYKCIDLLDKQDNSEIGKFATALYDKYKYGVDQKSMYFLEDEDINELLNNKVFEEFLNLTNIKLPIGKEYKRANGSIGKTKIKVTASDINKLNVEDKRRYVNDILKEINEILFYPYYDSYSLTHEVNISTDVLRSRLKDYINKVYRNYAETMNYQNALDVGKQNDINIDFVATNNAILNFDPAARKDISGLGIKGNIEQHPFVYVAADGSIKAEGRDKAFANKPDFKPGTAGILMDIRAGYPMIATLNESNPVANNKELVKAIYTEYDKLIKSYYNVSGEAVLEAYNNLYNFFNNLFGENALFNGWRVAKTDNSFTIYKLGENKQLVHVADFFKYAANFKDGKFVIGNETLLDEELKNHYNHTIYFHKSNNKSDNKAVLIKGIKGKKAQSKIDELINTIIDGATYSVFPVTVDETRTNPLITKHDKGFTLTIGEYKQNYKNYADFLVRNNAFKTTHMGVRSTNTYTADSKDSNAIYVRYTGVREYINEEEKRRQQGFRANLEGKGITKTGEETSEDILLDAGYSKDDIKEFDTLFKVLIPISTGIDFAEHEGAYAGFKDGKIFIYKKGIDAITADKREAVRILIHENVHRVIDDNGFFTSHKYGAARTEAIIDTWNQFYAAAHENEDLKSFIENFSKEYGTLRTSDKFEDRAKFANEWMAEVMSNKGLMDYLNNIDYQGNLDISQGSNKKSILQRILDVIKDLFTKLQNINKNTILDQFYKAVGNPIIRTINTEVTETAAVEEETASPDETILEEGLDKDIDEILKDVDLSEDLFIDDTLGEDEAFSRVEGTPEEIAIDSYLNDTQDNPYGLQLAPDMDSWLQSIPPHNRPALAAQMTTGAIQYICR